MLKIKCPIKPEYHLHLNILAKFTSCKIMTIYNARDVERTAVLEA